MGGGGGGHETDRTVGRSNASAVVSTSNGNIDCDLRFTITKKIDQANENKTIRTRTLEWNGVEARLSLVKVKNVSTKHVEVSEGDYVE